MTLRTVKVPEGVEGIFATAEQVVSRYFSQRNHDPEHGTIEIAGERYVLLRAASLSVEFFALVRELYGPAREDEADEFARNILFDLSHAIGRKDAKAFHAKMGLTDPIARLSAGPVHFAHAGWAFVDIFPASRPTPDDDYYLIYDHPYSFESDAWLRAGERRDFPVCIMSAGYSSGWCEESFGIDLVAAEVRCRARGDDTCRFVMAPPAHIAAHVRAQVPDGSSIIPDFFARKRAEEALRMRVEREVEARQRIERQLQQQHKLEALGRLAGGVAHDFNNLMAVVLANGALLERKLEAGDPRRAHVAEMIAAGQRAADLTRQLLAFGRAPSTAQLPIEIDGMVRELGRMLGRLIGDDVELHLALKAPGVYVRADRSQLDQILVNLVVNARDAMPQGGRLDIETVVTGPDIRLRVIDTGIGMDAETQALIFDPFFTTKDASQSSGLGLSTVYGIVQQLGGAITVDSAPGRGTTFDVRMPRLGGDDDGDTDDRHLEDDPDEPQPAATGRGEMVLLVEDLDMLREALEVLLTSLGYQVRGAATPQDALDMIDAGLVPAIVISDLMLPGMSGVELVELLEARLPGLHVLFMSGNPRDALDARRRRGQSTAFLSKPFSAADLTRELEKMRKPSG